MAAERRPADQRVLLLAPTTRDGEATRGLLASAGIGCTVCTSLDHLCVQALDGAATVIVPEEVVLSDESDRLARYLRQQPVWSDLPVIVLSRAGAESPAVEKAMATLGNVSLIERPMRVTTLLSVVRAALRARERQYQVRDHIEERLRAEAELRESEARFGAALAVAHLGTFEWDLRTDAVTLDRRSREIFGFAPGAGTRAQEVFARIDPADFPRVFEAAQASARDLSRLEIEYRIHLPDGARRTVVSISDVRRAPDGGGAEALFGVFGDVTEQKRVAEQREQLLASERAARAEAETANRAKDRFLAVLSHELRTPLTPVAMAATAMELDPRLPFEFRDDLAMIRRNVELETRLIDDLLDLSRVTSGKLRLNAQPTEVHRLIQHVLETVGPELHEKQLTVARDLAAADDRVDADPARLQQTLWNLLKNAAKFSPACGTVSIRTRNDEGRRLVVEVGDTGKGIAADVLPRIFDPFEQGGAEVTRQYGGMGLGLAIAKAVVDLHGGTIRAASDGEGKGAVFSVSLPLREPAGAPPPPPAGGPAEPRNRPVRLLLVEDHADTARMLVRLLRLDGSDVQWAGTVAAALALAAAEPFDVVVSDLGLPDGSGHDLIRQLLRDRAVAGIAMSGYGMEDDIRRSREAGFVEHLVKPVSLPQLRDAIRRVTPPKPA